MTKFKHQLSLSTISGVIFGVLAVFFIIFTQSILSNYLINSDGFSLLPISYLQYILGAFSVFFIGINYFLVIFLNKKKYQLKKWNSNTKSIRKIFGILLIIGSFLALGEVYFGTLNYILPTSMLLFGFGCVLVKNNTNGNTTLLGLLIILNGILGLIFTKSSFVLWGISFGLYPICYGLYYSIKKSIHKFSN